RHHRAKHARDLVAQRAHEVRDRGKVRGVIAGERDERDVIPAEALDAAAADDAVRIRHEHDLEKYRGRVGWGSGLVIAEATVEGREIDLVIEQMVDSMLERAGEELAREIDGEELRIGVDVLVAGHRREGEG